MKGIGSTGQTRGAVGVTRTGVEFGIDIKIAQLGISTDYGGGIVVGIGGQKIVWGREGGKIHYRVGGFEVLVEARDCVVVETKKIAGMVVSRHAYPDPGCKLPDPSPSIPQPTPLPPNPEPDQGIDVPNSNDLFWVPIRVTRLNYELFGSVVSTSTQTPTISNKEDPANITATKVPFDLSLAVKEYGYNEYTLRIRKNSLIQRDTILTGVWPREEEQQASAGVFKTSRSGLIAGFMDSGININNFLNIHRANTTAYLQRQRWGFIGSRYTDHFAPIDYVRIGEQRTLKLPLAGNQPPMLDSCCEALSADIEDIKQVLATKEILDGKMTFPWKWRMPGGQGEEIIMDYPNLMRAIAQMIDHLGIHPPKLSIKDINNAIAGNQSISNQFPSATQGFEALMAQVWDANADVDTLTNFLYRLSWLCVQQSMNIAILSGKVQSTLDMVGGETEPSETTITTPFNIGAGIVEKPSKEKGFGKNQINTKIEENTEIATESLLPDFLKIRENPIIIETFSGKQDLFDKITVLTLKIESLQNSLKG